jgi:hypothetical protein
VNPEDAPLLYNAAGEPKELWLLPNAEHCGAYFENRMAYVQKVSDFFDVHLRHASHDTLEYHQQKSGQTMEIETDREQLPEAS